MSSIIGTAEGSSYRVKFERKEFLELVDSVKPKLIYHVRRMHFFAFDGFVMYTFECADDDFNQKVLEAIEFSNKPWAETYLMVPPMFGRKQKPPTQ
jgi:hypothetical protein